MKSSKTPEKSWLGTFLGNVSQTEPEATEISAAKAEFRKLFSQTNPRLYQFLSSMVDGSIKDRAEVPY